MRRGVHAWRGSRLGPRAFAVALVLTCATSTAMAAGLQCGHLGTKTALTREQVDTMQGELLALGFDPGRHDGLWGPDTRAALHDFCLSAVFARNDDLRVMLRDHVAIHRAYPDWEATFAGKDFRQWMLRQKDAVDINRVRRSGDATQVSGLLQRYGQWLRQQKKPAKQPVERLPEKPAEKPAKKAVEKPAPGAGDVSYELTKADFKKLGSNEALAVAIDQLAGKTYADKAAFKAAAGEALKAVPDADAYVEALAGYGQQRVNYSLAKPSFDTMTVEGVPDYVQQALTGMQDLKYPAEAFVKAMDAALSALSAKAMALEPKLVTFAQITPAGARMSKASLAAMVKAYPGDTLVAAVAKALGPRQGMTFKSDKALAWAIKVELTAMVKAIEGAKPKIAAAAVRIPEFVIDKVGVDKVAGEVRQAIVPEGELKLLGGLQNLDYPEKGLFQRAVDIRIKFSNADNETRKAIDATIDHLNASALDDALLAAWAKAKVPPAVIDRLRSLQGKAFVDVRSFKAAVEATLQTLDGTYAQYLKRIIAQAKKVHVYRSLPIRWNGAGFGCVSKRLAGDVYGFYPYWMAGKEQSIDFSMQSRIDYFGLRLDGKGNITERRNWRQDAASQAFIREAHAHCTKVDMVVYHKDWTDWRQRDAMNKGLFFEAAAESIAKLVAEPMSDALSRAVPYLTLGMASVPSMGDGVTLDFPGYPQDKASLTAFEDFIQMLSDRLKGHRYALNLMFPSTDLGKGIYGYSRLFGLMQEVERRGLGVRFLILLQEPTTKDKKRVRQEIENHLQGEQRRQVLRHVAMVITPRAEDARQLDDDVDYAADNFGGIGFWAQPLMPAAKPVMAALQDHYQNGTGPSLHVVSDICRIVCPHRWLFRLAWSFFGLLLLAAIPLYLQACKWRAHLDKHFITYVACAVLPFVLLTFALLSCDPLLEKIARGNGLLLLVIAGIIAYAIWNYRVNKSKARLP